MAKMSPGVHPSQSTTENPTANSRGTAWHCQYNDIIWKWGHYAGDVSWQPWDLGKTLWFWEQFYHTVCPTVLHLQGDDVTSVWCHHIGDIAFSDITPSAFGTTSSLGNPRSCPWHHTLKGREKKKSRLLLLANPPWLPPGSWLSLAVVALTSSLHMRSLLGPSERRSAMWWQ